MAHQGAGIPLKKPESESIMSIVDKILTTSVGRKPNNEFTAAELCSSFGPNVTKEAVSDALSKAVEKGILFRRSARRGKSRVNYYRAAKSSRMLSKLWVSRPSDSNCTPRWY